MALTSPQAAKATELKAIITEFETTYKQSPTMMSMYGSYFFDLVAKLRAKIAEIESAS